MRFSGPIRDSRRHAATATALVLLLSLVLLAGCASRARISASNEIATAMFAIRDARASGAETYALPVLQQAEQLVAEARESSGAAAERLAERALANALLANTIAQRESARKQLAEAQRIDREAEALKERTTQAVEERLQ